jgi:nitric oxide reductase subunit B
MSMAADVHRPRTEDDPVSNVLKWTLLAVAVLTFALLAWATGGDLSNGAATAQPLRRVQWRCAYHRR